MSRVGAEARAPVSRLQTPVVRLSSSFTGSRRARAPCTPAGLERTRHRNPSCLSFEWSTSSRKTRDRSFPTTVLFKSSQSRFAAHPCRLTIPGPAVQRGGPESSCYLAPLQRPFDPHRVSSKMRLLSNRDNRRSLTSTSESIDSHAAPPYPKVRSLAGSAALDGARRTSVVTVTPPAPKRGRAGVARSLAGSSIEYDSSPPGDSSRSVALSTTVGKRVPPLTLLLRAPRAETLRNAPNAVHRPPRQGRTSRSTLRAPSIVEWSGPRLAP